MKFSFLILSISLLFMSYSQEDGWHKGRIKLKSGAKREGLVKVSKYGSANKAIIKFKQYKKAQEEQFTHVLVDTLYLIDSKNNEETKFKFVELFKDKIYLMKIVSEGKATIYGRQKQVTLWAMGTPGYGPPITTFLVPFSVGKYNEFFAIRDGEEFPSAIITVDLKKGFKKKASEYFKDCPSLVEKIMKKEFKKKDIEKVGEYYNSKCK